jgi:hypothetical protein
MLERRDDFFRPKSALSFGGIMIDFGNNMYKEEMAYLECNAM